MKKTMDPKFLDDKGTIFGINLDADFCAEHEWGIKGMQRELGISKDPASECKFGIYGRKVTKFPEDSFRLTEKDGYTVLVFSRYICREESLDRIADKLRLGSAPLCAAWDESSFAIAAKGPGSEFISRLYQAFGLKDVAVWLGGGGAFANAGLVIAIASEVPKKHRREMARCEARAKRLLDAATATGIEAKLKAAGKRWCSLSPRWADEQETEVEFWLNPCEHSRDNMGWFTVSDLLDWIEGKGRIPKK